MVAIEGTCMLIDESAFGTALYKPLEYREKAVPIRAIPYFAWGNRGKGEMQVFTRYK